MKHHPMFHTFFYMEATYIRLAKASHMTAAYSMGAEKCKVPVGPIRLEELKQVQNIPSGEYLIRGSRNCWQAGNKGWKAPSNYLYRLLQENG